MDIEPAHAAAALTPSASKLTLSRNTTGMPGTIGGLVLRVLQFVAAAVAFLLMLTSDEMPGITGFRRFTVVSASQCSWSICMALFDAFLLLTGRLIQDRRIHTIVLMIDVALSTTLIVYVAGVWGIFSLYKYDYFICDEKDCRWFQAMAMAGFVSWLLEIPSCFFELVLVALG